MTLYIIMFGHNDGKIPHVHGSSTQCQIQHFFLGYHSLDDNSEERRNAKLYKGDDSKTQHKDTNVNFQSDEHHTNTHFRSHTLRTTHAGPKPGQTGNGTKVTMMNATRSTSHNRKN